MMRGTLQDGARDVAALSMFGHARAQGHAFTSNRSCCGPGRPALRAFTIIEAVIYISVLFVLLGAAYMAMYRCIDRSVALRRNANGLTAALEAGERWRADVRSASGPVQIDRDLLRIPTSRGEITYRFEDHSVLRRISSNNWVALLDDVKSSGMQSDRRQQVTAWRWDFELLPVRKDTADTNRFHPLFTFLAVPNPSTKMP